MQDDEATRRKLADIGARFLARTIGEIAMLEELLKQLPGNALAGMKQIEMIAHRIRGSGAVFGFQALSNAAESIEMLALQTAGQENIDVEKITPQLLQAIAALSAECAKIDGSLQH